MRYEQKVSKKTKTGLLFKMTFYEQKVSKKSLLLCKIGIEVFRGICRMFLIVSEVFLFQADININLKATWPKCSYNA